MTIHNNYPCANINNVITDVTTTVIVSDIIEQLVIVIKQHHKMIHKRSYMHIIHLYQWLTFTWTAILNSTSLNKHTPPFYKFFKLVMFNYSCLRGGPFPQCSAARPRFIRESQRQWHFFQQHSSYRRKFALSFLFGVWMERKSYLCAAELTRSTAVTTWTYCYDVSFISWKERTNGQTGQHQLRPKALSVNSENKR